MLELSVNHDGATYIVEFEHSLRSVSKWESKHRKTFFSRFEMNAEELLDYYSCMIVTPGVSRDLVYAMSVEHFQTLETYMLTEQTASTVPDIPNQNGVKETLTSELIYYWMTELKINWEAQDWHLSRLMMLIRITSFKKQPKKARNAKATMDSWRDINERQKKLLGIED